MRQMIRTIRKKVPEAELLAQLAEEAVELAHAALKLRRTLSTQNPTPISNSEARQRIDEEIADVLLLLDVIGLSPDRVAISNIQHGKLDRWVRRLQDPPTEKVQWTRPEPCPITSEQFNALYNDDDGEAADAIDRLTPKKPEMRADEGFAPEVSSHLCCPTCNNPVTNYWKPGAKPKHCQFCGQAIDWEKEEPDK